MPRYTIKEILSQEDEEDFMAAMEIILCEHHNRPAHHRNPDLILPHVYIGNIGNAENYRLLQKHGITHVLNCAGFKGTRSYEGSPYQGLDIEYKEFLADDSESYNMSQHFRDSFIFMDRAKRKSGSVLVHCAQGINRSVAVCVAYLMMEKDFTLLKAVKHVQKKRGCVLSNRGFQRQLVKFAHENGCLDSRTELEKILPKKETAQKCEHVQNGDWSYDGHRYKNYDYDGHRYNYDGHRYKNYDYDDYTAHKKHEVMEKANELLVLNKDTYYENGLNGATVATGSSIFEDYLRRMKSN